MATASPMWSPWPCVQISASAFFTSFSLSGHMGLFITQGSTYTVAPSAVSMRKLAWPSQVSLLPARFMRMIVPATSAEGGVSGVGFQVSDYREDTRDLRPDT